jgi:hypothetical protein
MEFLYHLLVGFFGDIVASLVFSKVVFFKTNCRELLPILARVSTIKKTVYAVLTVSDAGLGLL